MNHDRWISNRHTSINSNTTCQCPASTFTPSQFETKPSSLRKTSDPLILTHRPELSSFQRLSIFNQTWTPAASSDNTAAVRSQRTPCPASAPGLDRNTAFYRSLNVCRHICRSTEPQTLQDHQTHTENTTHCKHTHHDPKHRLSTFLTSRHIIL